jgi:hypothetical protein
MAKRRGSGCAQSAHAHKCRALHQGPYPLFNGLRNKPQLQPFMSYHPTLAVSHYCNQVHSRAPLKCWGILAATKSRELYLRADQRKALASLCGAEAHCVATTHICVCATGSYATKKQERHSHHVCVRKHHRGEHGSTKATALWYG